MLTSFDRGAPTCTRRHFDRITSKGLPVYLPLGKPSHNYSSAPWSQQHCPCHKNQYKKEEVRHNRHGVIGPLHVTCASREWDSKNAVLHVRLVHWGTSSLLPRMGGTLRFQWTLRPFVCSQPPQCPRHGHS